MAAILYPIYTLGHLGLTVWALRLWRRGRQLATMLILLTLIGLVYDNLAISLGRWIGEGALLETANNLRFLTHALFTPLWVMVSFELARRAGVGFVQSRAAMILFWLITSGLIAFGFTTQYMVLDLIPVEFNGTLRYAEPPGGGPPIAPILTIIFVIVFGAAIWRARRWPWLFLGGLAIFIMAAIPPSLVGPVVASGGELVAVTALLATDQHLLDKSKDEEDTQE